MKGLETIHNRHHHIEDDKIHTLALTQDLQSLLAVFRYIVRNPIKAKLAKSENDWEWSSHGEMVTPPPAPIIDREAALNCFSSDPAQSLRTYQALVGMNSPPMILPMELPDFELEDEALTALASKISREADISISDLRNKHKTRKAADARRNFVKAARQFDYSWSKIGRFMERTPAAIIHLAR